MKQVNKRNVKWKPTLVRIEADYVNGHYYRKLRQTRINDERGAGEVGVDYKWAKKWLEEKVVKEGAQRADFWEATRMSCKNGRCG